MNGPPGERAPWSPPRFVLGVRAFIVPAEFCPFCRFVVFVGSSCSCGSSQHGRWKVYQHLRGYLDAERWLLDLAALKREPGALQTHIPIAPAFVGGSPLYAFGYREVLRSCPEEHWPYVARGSPEALRLKLLLPPQAFVDSRAVLARARLILASMGEKPVSLDALINQFAGGTVLALHALRCAGLVRLVPGGLWARRPGA